MNSAGSNNRDATVDHLVYCVPDLESGIAEFEALSGIRAAHGGRHPGVGTHNALVSLGPRSYLEIIAPDPGQDDFRRPRVFRLDEVSQPTLVTWALATSRIRSLASTSFGNGQRLGELRSLSRVRPDGVELSWTMTDPYEEIDGGVVPFLIDWGDTPHPGGSAPPGATLRELRALHPDPDGVTGRLATLGMPLAVAAADQARLVALLDTPAGPVELN